MFVGSIKRKQAPTSDPYEITCRVGIHTNIASPWGYPVGYVMAVARRKDNPNSYSYD